MNDSETKTFDALNQLIHDQEQIIDRKVTNRILRQSNHFYGAVLILLAGFSLIIGMLLHTESDLKTEITKLEVQLRTIKASVSK